jgi:hypothetical protein
MRLGKLDTSLAFLDSYPNDNNECFDVVIDTNGVVYMYSKLKNKTSESECDNVLNYFEKKLNTIIPIYFNPKVSSNNDTIIFSIHESPHDSNSLYYSIRQEMSKTMRKIGIIQLDDECVRHLKQVDDFQMNKFNEKFELHLNNESSRLEIYSRENLDYEWTSVYEFRIVAKCAPLWTRSIRIELIDLNDNQPRFLSPVGNGQLINVEVNSYASLVFLMQIKGTYLLVSFLITSYC